MYSTRKRREPKTPKITPIKVLLRNRGGTYEYTTHTIIGLRYKQKTKPDLITDKGDTILRWWDRGGIYLDTPENRKRLEEAQELRDEINRLNGKINAIMTPVEQVDRSKLWETEIDE